MAKTLFNPQLLADLRESAGAEIIQEILDAYFESLTQHIVMIDAAIETLNPSSLFELAHGIKGISANIGATEMTELAVELETYSRSNDKAALVEILEKIKIGEQNLRIAIAQEI